MKTSTFRDLLLKNADKSMSDQLDVIQNHLEKWQRNFEQLDDITVLGVRIA